MSDQTILPVPDSHGVNRFRDDPQFSALLRVYLDDALREHVQPILDDLGSRVGAELDDLAHDADQNPPSLTHRTRRGEERQTVLKHPAYQALEKAAFGELGLATMSHAPGVLGWPQVMDPQVKYALTYLFVQAEFGLLCPVNMTDSLTRTLTTFGSAELVAQFLPHLTTTDFDELYQGAMFITEQGAGSDVGQLLTTATDAGDGTWRLSGSKWFCSNPDADLAMVLARPEGAQAGIRGLGLFLLPRLLKDGTPNSYRIVRLKDKLGSRSMASGEIELDGATAYLVGDINRGFSQMADMINSSRLSNGVRAAGMMRRAFAEARHVALNRSAFGEQIINLPLMRRQLVKMLVPAEQARSVYMHIAHLFPHADAGDDVARQLIRILTPLVKFRATRDNRKVTGDGMEVRGGVGYIEEFGDARMVRDAHLGSIWEGTSNIVALDVARAAKRTSALDILVDYLTELIVEAGAAQSQLWQDLIDKVGAQMLLATKAENEWQTREAATALYNLASAIFMMWEAARMGDDQTRRALASLVVRHRLLPHDPLNPVQDDEDLVTALLLGEPVGASLADRAAL
ncbi:isovaleryl-CoA dehydrogenase [Intrasporangium chromatireducens Q5-1]|uniref:Isovaleryl-CoA dehydrogenase n=1 Tax=Intrasporangium chromatireducens Q5-1 TaxID=584657 RepID=W9GQV6_9MICO|nr:acyl-CoA dehydrogenase family protein [Intrasporangium chromatireducens]EWT06269.1 isovaleryl-CoA dehydrogenase [Intrasporangium chromatireducens Q5-1]